DLYSATGEHLGGMKIAKSYCAEERHISHFSRVSDDVAGAYLSSTRNYADRRLFFSIGSVFLLSGLVYLAAEVLFLPAATLLIFLFLFSRLIPRFSALQQSYQQILNALPAVDRVQTLLDRAERAAERPDRMDPALRLRERVHLDKVAFDYSGDGAAIAVKNVSVTIEAGRTTAIVGPSGSGKSTLADLVMGLLVPTEGRVLVDGVSLQSGVLQSWRKHIGYVAQDTFFFHDTVRTNLLWASPDASDQELWEALTLASASHFVEQLPAGIETVVGDRGVKLSGGERQRLALARALLRKPELLILDEATSSLDSENERRVQRAIESLHGEMTILIIAHRLATIRDADHIHVMERGRIVESGAWDDLLARRGRFHELFVTQSLHTSGDLHPHDAEAEGATTTDSAVERTF
nr:ABC transporter ATP-binding protein [Gemmatimonadota bacterium]